MQLDPRLLHAISIMRSEADTNAMVLAHISKYPDSRCNTTTFSRALEAGRASDEVAKTIYDFYKSKAAELKDEATAKLDDLKAQAGSKFEDLKKAATDTLNKLKGDTNDSDKT